MWDWCTSWQKFSAQTCWPSCYPFPGSCPASFPSDRRHTEGMPVHWWLVVERIRSQKIQTLANRPSPAEAEEAHIFSGFCVWCGKEGRQVIHLSCCLLSILLASNRASLEISRYYSRAQSLQIHLERQWINSACAIQTWTWGLKSLKAKFLYSKGQTVPLPLASRLPVSTTLPPNPQNLDQWCALTLVLFEDASSPNWMKTNPVFCTNDIGVATMSYLLKFNNMLDPTHGMPRCIPKISPPKSLHFTSNQDFSKKMDPNLTRISDFCPNLCADSSNCRYHSVYLWDMRSPPQIEIERSAAWFPLQV